MGNHSGILEGSRPCLASGLIEWIYDLEAKASEIAGVIGRQHQLVPAGGGREEAVHEGQDNVLGTGLSLQPAPLIGHACIDGQDATSYFSRQCNAHLNSLGRKVVSGGK